jgi:two-component sensor histidine kinase
MADLPHPTSIVAEAPSDLVVLFAEATRLVGDPMLLLRPDSTIVAANRAASAALGLPAPGAAWVPGELAGAIRLRDLASDPAEADALLRQCAAAADTAVGRLGLRRAGGDAAYRVEGAAFRPAQGPALIQLRLRSHESFALLSEKLDALADGRSPAPAEFRFLLEARDALVRELQHRVRNKLQVVLSLISRELRLAGDDEPARTRLQSLAERVHALGFVQKQLGSGSEAHQLRLDLLVQDIVQHVWPGDGAEIADDLPALGLTVQCATPLALLLTECLAVARGAGATSLQVGWSRPAAGRLRLDLHAPSAATAFTRLTSDPLARMLATQMDGQVTSEGDRFTTELSVIG